MKKTLIVLLVIVIVGAAIYFTWLNSARQGLNAAAVKASMLEMSSRPSGSAVQIQSGDMSGQSYNETINKPISIPSWGYVYVYDLATMADVARSLQRVYPELAQTLMEYSRNGDPIKQGSSLSLLYAKGQIITVAVEGPACTAFVDPHAFTSVEEMKKKFGGICAILSAVRSAIKVLQIPPEVHSEKGILKEAFIVETANKAGMPADAQMPLMDPHVKAMHENTSHNGFTFSCGDLVETVDPKRQTPAQRDASFAKMCKDLDSNIKDEQDCVAGVFTDTVVYGTRQGHMANVEAATFDKKKNECKVTLDSTGRQTSTGIPTEVGSDKWEISPAYDQNLSRYPFNLSPIQTDQNNRHLKFWSDKKFTNFAYMCCKKVPVTPTP